jgi:hypothetical protein
MRLILFFLLISFASCQKCQTCNQVITTRIDGEKPETIETEFEACGSDLREFKDNKSVFTTVKINGVTAKVTTTTNCK